MKIVMLGLVLALATAVAPAPPAQDRASVVCLTTPLYVWAKGETLPRPAGGAGIARVGESFPVYSGPKATLEGFQLYELDMLVGSPGYGPNDRYWIAQPCVSISHPH
jgi:hypothetical protein